MLVQKLRLKKGWSQQQLADISGVSLRTIQRIEAGQTGSMESLKAVAAAFNLEFSELSQETSMESSIRNDVDQEEVMAFQHVRKLRKFYLHLFKYIIFSVIMLTANLLMTPDKKWAFWAIGDGV